MITGTLSGRLTADPTVRQGQNGNFTTFSVAVNHGKKDNVDQVTYVDCSANGKTGELVAEHFKKGNVFSGPAEFRMREYESNGQKKQQLSATISMVDWNASQTTPKEQQAAPAPAPAQPAWGAPPPTAGYAAAAPMPAPQVQYDQFGNQYQLINGQWQMTQQAAQGAPPSAPSAPAPAPAQGWGAPPPATPPQQQALMLNGQRMPF